MRTAAEGATAERARAATSRACARSGSRSPSSRPAVEGAASSSTRSRRSSCACIREEFTKEYRGIVIDDPELYEEVRGYVEAMAPELADRVELYDEAEEGLPLFERFHVQEQLLKALDRKVWLPSGGSLIIERTEALTVIDVNTGKNVGQVEPRGDRLPQQPRGGRRGGPPAPAPRHRRDHRHRLHRHGDQEEPGRRACAPFRDALARDKTRTQVFDISELGLVEMTRKRISEGLVETFSQTCETCQGRGFLLDESLLE